MSVPPFAPFPAAQVRQNILPAEWSMYLDSWTALTELYLRLPDQDFFSTLLEPGTLTNFLISFFHELAQHPSLAPTVVTLRKKCFFLLHRICSQDDIPANLLHWQVLADICHVFLKSDQLRGLLQSMWKRKGGVIEKTLQTAKTSVIRSLESKSPENAADTLNKLGPLLKLSPDAGVFMLTGSDLLDSLSSAYAKTPPDFQKKLVTTTYLGLNALLEVSKPNYSLLSDHLYSLRTAAEQERKTDAAKRIFLADLVTNTPLLNKIRDSATSSEGARVKNIAASLSAFQQSSIARPKKLVRRKVDKGKGKANEDEYGHGTFGEVHIHRMSLISQIQDLFPELGSGFLVKLLDEYNDSVEEVTAHLLEDSLPPHLANADRTQQL